MDVHVLPRALQASHALEGRTVRSGGVGTSLTDGTRKQDSRLERWVPGVGVARTYERSWLRFDLVAGVVLAAILVPQGMAYAELAGLPPVTGLYTTIACLVGYALFGPSRVLVLGPDSSISPLIFAAIVPLLAGGDPARAIALAGMLALFVGLIEIGLGLGKFGFVADLLSSEVQIGYMNGLAITIIVGQLPKLFGFSTDADGFFARDPGLRPVPEPDESRDSRRRPRRARSTARAPTVHQARARGPCRGRWRDRRFERLGPRRARRLDRWLVASGIPDASVAVDQRERHGAAAHRRRRYHTRLPHRHHRDVDQLQCPSG